VDALPDTVTLYFPARLAPSLLSLKAAGPLAAGNEAASSGGPGWGGSLASTVALSGVGGAGGAGPVPGTASAAGAGATAPDPPGESIVFGGIKTISVEMGANRAAALEQSLDLTVRGRVSGGVEVAASLSDRRLPFEPDGSSRELEDLDKIALSIRAPRAEATMGDFQLDGLPGQFARISRQLQGVRGSAMAVGSRWNAAAASAKGERRSIEFRGVEGSQGPYALLSRAAASSDAGVVGGSEVVWLDGARMRRGADADYVIDYGAGTVTFTVRHPITSQSRIAIDFEASSSRYRRGLYAATTQGGHAGASWFGSYVREGDDSGNPIGASLTPADREILSRMGDSVADSLPSGVTYKGPGQGSYAWDASDAAHPRWVYLGPSLGDYDVEFTSVGPGQGAYADTVLSDATRIFRYRGENLGAYAPGRPLAVPSSKSLVDFGGSARLFGGGAIGVEGEIARTANDLNALSSLDDGDNEGTAARFAARLEPRRLGAWGTFRVSGQVRSVDEHFSAFDRIDPSFEGERWNQGNVGGGEVRHEVAMQYDLGGALSLKGEVGHRSLSGGSRSLRRGASAEVRSIVSGAVYGEGARNQDGISRGSREALGLDLTRTKGWILPRVSARDERIQGQAGDSADARASRELTLGLGLAPSAGFQIRGGVGAREDEAVLLGGADRTRDEARYWDGGLIVRRGAGFSFESGFTRRRTTGDGGPRNTDLAQMALLAGKPGGPVTSEVRYDVTQLREVSVARELQSVGSSMGSYDAYGNPRLGGGYEIVTVPGVSETRARATVQWRLDAYPGRAAATRPKARRSLFSGLGGSTFLRVETQSRLPLGAVENAFRPGAYLDPSATLRGSFTGRQSVEWLLPGGRADVRGELGFRRDQQGEIAPLRSRRDAVDGRFGLRHPLPGRLRASWSARADRAEQEIVRFDTDQGATSLLRGRGFEMEISKDLQERWSVSVLSRQRRDADITHGGVIDTWSAGPAARYAAGARMRVDAKVLWGETVQRGAYAPPGFAVLAAPGSRLDYDVLGEYRVRDRIALSFSWTGFQSKGRPSSYTGRCELRGYF
jgi:hypothetical protein